MKGLWSGLRFLTCVPVPRQAAGEWSGIGGALPWFPTIGLLIGALLVIADFAVRQVAPSLLASALVVLLWVLLSGGLHLDGLADSADAAFAPADRERRLEILRDPHVGAFGVLAIAGVLLVKVAALDGLPLAARALALLLAPTLGRWGIVFCASCFSYPRAFGLGQPFHAAGSSNALVLASVLPAGVLLALAVTGTVTQDPAVTPALIGTVLAACVLAAVLAATWFSRRFGGLTGDGYGAVCELVESVALVSAAIAARAAWIA